MNCNFTSKTYFCQPIRLYEVFVFFFCHPRSHQSDLELLSFFFLAILLYKNTTNGRFRICSGYRWNRLGAQGSQANQGIRLSSGTANLDFLSRASICKTKIVASLGRFTPDTLLYSVVKGAWAIRLMQSAQALVFKRVSLVLEKRHKGAGLQHTPHIKIRFYFYSCRREWVDYTLHQWGKLFFPRKAAYFTGRTDGNIKSISAGRDSFACVSDIGSCNLL